MAVTGATSHTIEVPNELSWRPIATAILSAFSSRVDRARPFFVGLQGDMGAGKTTLVRAIAAELKIPSNQIASPTYALQHIYAVDSSLNSYGVTDLEHWDLYRVRELPEELQYRDTYCSDTLQGDTAQGVLVLVEWPERCGLEVDLLVLIAHKTRSLDVGDTNAFDHREGRIVELKSC